MHFFCHKMLVGVCVKTKKHFTGPFLAFCANYEVNLTPNKGQKMAKLKVFGHFEILMYGIEFLKLFICILLVKIQLLVPNLCLQGLVSRFYGQKTAKNNASILKSGSSPTHLWTVLSYNCAFVASTTVINVFQTVVASFSYLNYGYKCLHFQNIAKFVGRKAQKPDSFFFSVFGHFEVFICRIEL